MRIFHPDIGMMSNYSEITSVIALALDLECGDTGYSWYSDSPFLFSHSFKGKYVFDFDFKVIDMATGEEDIKMRDKLNKRLHEMFSFRPKILMGCPVCRKTTVVDANGRERWSSSPCPWCHNCRLFIYFVTSKVDVKLFCEARQFMRPSTYCGLH